jgi:hypothetical protein
LEVKLKVKLGLKLSADFFTLKPPNVELWISTIRYGLKQRRLLREHWVAVALHFMSDEPRNMLEEAQREMWIEWDWERLTAALVHIESEVVVVPSTLI